MSPGSVQHVYFFCREPDFSKNPPCHWYQHLSVCLAEGLKELGIEVFSNINHWSLSAKKGEYLFNHSSKVRYEDCSIVIVNDAYVLGKRALPKDLFSPGRKYITVFLDGLDVMRTRAFEPEFRQFDYILQAHYSSKAWYPSNVYPWAFGLSHRILEQTQVLPSFSEKSWSLMVNFRHTSNMHSVRSYINRTFLPLIEQHILIERRIDEYDKNLSGDDLMNYIQTGQRHFPDYYHRLRETSLVACFGGFFVAPFIHNHSSKLSFQLKRVIKKLGIKTNHIIQWESWRFWEALVAGSVAIHLDFEKYGVKLPIMPKNWHHYIGIDLDNLDTAVDRIVSDKSLLESIASQGRNWALQHYHFLPTAQRFLDLLQVSFSPEFDNDGGK